MTRFGLSRRLENLLPGGPRSRVGRGAREFRRARLERLEPRQVLSAPTLLNLPTAVSLQSGTPLYIALDGFDADGDTLSFEATSDSNQLSTFIPEGNESLRISVSQHHNDGTITSFGDMTLELFDARAPNTTDRIKELANVGFYDGVIFHRVIDGFMIQGGDPDGTGFGGSGVDFDDEFHPDLRHVGSGVLSMANSGPNTNDSQFFITDVSTPFLDDAHTVFGYLTEGDDIRERIQTIATDSGNRPLEPVVMDQVSVFLDQENGLLMLSALSGPGGQATVTITVTDTNGESSQHTIDVELPAVWEQVERVEITAGSTGVFPLPDLGIAGVTYTAAPLANGSHPDFVVDFDPDGQQVVVATSPSVQGVQWITARATTADGSVNELQQIPVYVTPAAPLIELAPSSDTGTSDDDGITAYNNTPDTLLDFWVFGVGDAAELSLFVDGQEVAHTQTASVPLGGADSGINQIRLHITDTTGLDDGPHAFTVQQSLDLGNDYEGEILTSVPSPVEVVVVDTRPPTVTSTPGTVVPGGTVYTYDVETDEESFGVLYAFNGSTPSGLAIDSISGLITWSPGIDQVGTHHLVVDAVDWAGNTATHEFDVSVSAPPEITPIGDRVLDELGRLEFLLTASDVDGEPNYPINFTLGENNLPDDAVVSLTQLDSTNASFTWATREEDGPATYQVTFVATDASGAVASETIEIRVRELNQSPELTRVYDNWTVDDDWTIDEGELLSLDFQAVDRDLPAQDLVFTLGADAPDGAFIDPASGEFSWIPSELQGGIDWDLLVRVRDIEGGMDEATIHVSVDEVDSPPVIQPIPTQFVIEGETLRIQVVAEDPDRAQDPDQPLNEMKYRLDATGAPEGMTIDPDSGELTWTAPADYLDRHPRGGRIFPVVQVVEISPRRQLGLTSRMTFEIVVVNDLEEMMAAAMVAERSGQAPLLLISTPTSPHAMLDSSPSGASSSSGPTTSTNFDDRGLFGSQLGSSLGSDLSGGSFGELGEEEEDGEIEKKETDDQPDDESTELGLPFEIDWLLAEVTDAAMDAEQAEQFPPQADQLPPQEATESSTPTENQPEQSQDEVETPPTS